MQEQPYRLRALLIQKDTKLPFTSNALLTGLRALLIQKDTKRLAKLFAYENGLRALLIQKDTKLQGKKENLCTV